MNNFDKLIYGVLKESKTKHKSPPVISRGAEFSMAGAGKAGVMKADRPEFKKKKSRKEGKDIAKRAMRGDY